MEEVCKNEDEEWTFFCFFVFEILFFVFKNFIEEMERWRSGNLQVLVRLDWSFHVWKKFETRFVKAEKDSRISSRKWRGYGQL